MLHEVLIDRKNTHAFEALIPEMYREELKKEQLYGVATFDGRLDPACLVGVVLVRTRLQWQEIVWTALTEKYGTCEYGADIIKNRAEDAREGGALLGTYSVFPVKETLHQDYFSCAGFSYETFFGHAFTVYTHALFDHPLELDEDEALHCFSLRYLTPGQKQEMQKAVQYSQNPMPLEPSIKWDSYDKDASVLYEKDGEILGAILISKNTDFYSVESLFGSRMEIIETLFRYLSRISKKALNGRSRLIIPATDASLEEKLIRWPDAHQNELALVCLGYENVKKRVLRTNEFLQEYAARTELSLLGIEGMELCPPFDGSGITIDGQGLLACSHDAVRKREAVYERFWKKTEAWCQRKALPPVMVIIPDLAKIGYRQFREGKLKPTDLEDAGFTKRPLYTFQERERMSSQFAGLIATAKDLSEDLSNRSPDTLSDKCKFLVDSRILNLLSEVTESFFSLAGVNIRTGKEVPAKDRVSLGINSRVKMSEFRRLYSEYDARVTEEMIRAVEKEDSFKQKLKETAERISKQNRSVLAEQWEHIRALDSYKEKKKQFDRAMEEKGSLLDQLSKIEARIEVLKGMQEFSGRDALIEELYFYKKRSAGFGLDSIEGYLQYLNDGTPMKAMYGIYIRKKLDEKVPCPNPNKRLDRQIDRLEPRFTEVLPEEAEGVSILLGWERMLIRTDRKKEPPLPPNHPDIDHCRKRLQELEKKKENHPELFRELLLSNMFDDIPEMVELFEEAKALRDEAARLLDDGFTELHEKYDIWCRSLAIYDTLLRRARHIIVASRMSMNELMQQNPDFHTTDYEYCLKESIRISNRR